MVLKEKTLLSHGLFVFVSNDIFSSQVEFSYFLLLFQMARSSCLIRKKVKLCESRIIIMVMKIIALMTLKGTIQNVILSPDWATNCLQHVCSSDQGAIVYKSCATHWALITCNMSCITWYEEIAHLLSFTELK